MILKRSWDITRHLLQYFQFPNTRWLNVDQLLTHIENIRIGFFFETHKTDCVVLSKQKIDEIELILFCYIFNILCRYSTRDVWAE